MDGNDLENKDLYTVFPVRWIKHTQRPERYDD